MRARSNTAVVRAALLVAAVAVTVSAAGPNVAPARVESVGCTADRTKALIHALVRDYAAGRVATIDRLWAPAPRFQWFSTGPPGARLGARAYDRATLAGYFRSRVRVHERLRLTRLGAGYDATRDIVNFSGKLMRSADDI